MTAEAIAEFERIRTLKAKYFRLMDQQAWDEWRDLFVDDLDARFPDDGGHHRGRDSFVRHVSAALSGAVSMHQGQMSELILTSEERAEGIWGMNDTIWFPPGSPRQKLSGCGWYYEEYQRCDDGEWRFKRILLRRQYVEIDGKKTVPSH